MKCPSCGSDNPADRFYCGRCGGDLRSAERPPQGNPIRLVKDVDSRALTIALLGVVVAIFGLIIYGIGLSWNQWTGIDAWYTWPGLVWIVGFSMFSLGVFFNMSQRMPPLLRSSASLLIVAAVAAFIFCFAVAATPTRVEIIGNPGDERTVVYYGNAIVMSALLLPLCLLPLVGAWKLLIMWKWALPAAIGYAVFGLVVAWELFSEYIDTVAVVSLSALYLCATAALFASSIRRNPVRLDFRIEPGPQMQGIPIDGVSRSARTHNRIFSVLPIPSRMRLEKDALTRQYERQSTWLRESLEWLVKTRIVASDQRRGRLSALDVGCGPGIVMEMLRPSFSAVGIDMDSTMVQQARRRGFEAVRALAESLPFEDASFEVAYCSWLLLWVSDPRSVVAEMKRVSRGWVFCMAEPDYGARIDHPGDLSELGEILADGIRGDGGDPHIGRKLRDVFNSCGMEPEISIHPGVWDIDRLREESEAEWDFVRLTAGDTIDPGTLDRLKESWDKALAAGTLMQFNPVFYALARVP